MEIEISVSEAEFLKHTAYYLDKAAEGRSIVIQKAPTYRLRLQMEVEACEQGLCQPQAYKEEFRSYLASLGVDD